MSDPDAMPDPLDKAYAEAETALSDDATRAARRARVLAAIAEDAATAPASATKPARRPAWGGWLAAACVAGLSVLVVDRIYDAGPARPRTAPPVAAGPVIVPPSQPSPSAAVASPARPTGRAASVAPRPSAALRSAPAPIMEAQPPPPPSPPPPPPPPLPQPPPPPAPAEPPAAGFSRALPQPSAQAQPSSSSTIEEVVTTGSRLRAAADAKPSAEMLERAARLRAAAAGGRATDVAALLSAGVPVDAADDEGETALMKAVRAKHATIAALLRRRGADLDHTSQAGVSARDLAAEIADPKLDRALGIGRGAPPKP